MFVEEVSASVNILSVDDGFRPMRRNYMLQDSEQRKIILPFQKA